MHILDQNSQASLELIAPTLRLSFCSTPACYLRSDASGVTVRARVIGYFFKLVPLAGRDRVCANSLRPKSPNRTRINRGKAGLSLEGIIARLDAGRQRATYGAVAKLVGVLPRSVMSGPLNTPNALISAYIAPVLGETSARTR
jgi:hypothetical protein